MNELERIIAERHEQFAGLLALTVEQEAAITHAHMNELMRVLEEKQRRTQIFVELSQRLRRSFELLGASAAVTEPYRLMNEQCNAMHRELIARERACEQAFAPVRREIREDSVHADKGRRAAVGYNPSRPELLRGDRLDLSSDE